MEGEVLYRHQAERDPFTPLVRGGGQQGPEVKVRPGTTGIGPLHGGVLQPGGGPEDSGRDGGVVPGPGQQAYKVSVGERFADGVVLDISYDSGEVTVQQELNDPTAIKPFRNLVLRIRSLEGEGQ